MPEKVLPFVITDRRKFTTDGQPREGSEDATGSTPLEPEPESAPEQTPALEMEPSDRMPSNAAVTAVEDLDVPNAATLEDLPAAPTQDQMEQSRRAFDATAERLDVAVRAANPGAEHPPALTFESLIQSVYMQAVLQLGGGTQEGVQPQVDLLGARQSIDMLGILADKTQGNLSPQEELILSSAVFELRLAFLEMTQVLARSAAQRSTGVSPPAGRSGPSIVR